MDWCQVLNKSRDARLPSLCRHLPSATLKSFFTDATGGYPSGVLDCSLLYVTAQPATKSQVTALLLTGVVAALRPPLQQNRPTPHVPQPLLHLVRASQAPTDCDVALLTEQARGGVRQV